MRLFGLALAILTTIAGIGAAHAANQLLNWGDGSVRFIGDGTSNTITFGENTRFNMCFDNVNVPGGITDGSSNTILIGEQRGFFVIPGGSGPRVPITSITDGTSNTIFIGETIDLCLNNVVPDPAPPAQIPDGASNTIIIGEGSFDVCFSHVGRTQLTSIGDGTSNTIIISQDTSACFTDVEIAQVPAPPALAGALVGLVLLPFGLRKRRAR